MLSRPFGDVIGARYKMPFVVCASCGAAIAVLSHDDPGATAKLVLQEVKALGKQIEGLETKLRSIKSSVNR